MPWIQKPALFGLPGGKHAVKFSYEFAGDAIGPVNIGGTVVIGTLLTINPSELQNSVGLGAFKAIQFLSDSIPATVADPQSDGGLWISSPTSGQLITHGYNNEPSPAAPVSVTAWVTGVSELVSVKDGIIQIAKAAKSGVLLVGGITATLFDFALAPYIERFTTS